MLQGVAHVQCVKHPQESGDEKNHPEDETEAVDAQGRQGVLEHLPVAVVSVRQRDQLYEAEHGQGKHVQLARPAAGGGYQQRTDDQDKRGIECA